MKKFLINGDWYTKKEAQKESKRLNAIWLEMLKDSDDRLLKSFNNKRRAFTIVSLM